MPRPPNAKSKSPTITIKPYTEWEEEFRAFKEIIARNPDLTIKKEIYKRAIQPFLRDHNWPPGSSQVLMTKFVEKRLVEKKKCSFPRCDQDAIYIGFPEPPGEPKVYLCENHKKHALENRLLKNYKPLERSGGHV